MTTELLRNRSSRTGALCKKRAGEEKLSRRDFFKLGRAETAVIPGVDRTLCPRPEACGICRESCTVEAIRLRSGKIRIDQDRCVACGACTVACPRGALVYPGFTAGQMDLEIEGLLKEKAGRDSHPRIVAFTCADKNSDPVAYPDRVLPLYVPCLAMVSPHLVLRAFTFGAQGAVLMPAAAGCGLNREIAGIRFLRELFTGWSIDPLRIHVWSGAAGELKEYEQTVNHLPALRLAGSSIGSVREKELPLAALITAMENSLGASGITGVGKGTAPFGVVRVDSDRCTGCGLCGLNCPTDALTFSPLDDDGSYRILFSHDRCTGCGVCRKSCPEGAIAVDRILQINQLNRPAAILFRDRLSSCRECGAPLVPRAMILRLKARLSAAGEAARTLDLCPACRVKGAFLPGRAVEDRSKEITLEV